MTPRVLVIGPGRQGRGGITSVIEKYVSSSMWQQCDCAWLETYRDSTSTAKMWAASKALLSAPFAMRGKNIVHIHATFETSLLRKTPFLLLAKLLRKKVVLHIHSPDPTYLDRMGPNGFAARVLRAADTVVALSPTWANLLRKSGARVVIIPNPVILPAPDVGGTDSDRHPTILYMGKVERRKGYEDLIQAMSVVLSKFPNAILRVAGHGEIASARRLANELGISKSIEFLGWVSQEDRERLYRSADVFCLPSYSEGVPMALLEAMSFRLAVVCTPVGGIPDLITSGENGVFVQPGDAREIASALIDLLEHMPARAAMGAAAYKTVERISSLQVVARELAALYADLLTPNASHHSLETLTWRITEVPDCGDCSPARRDERTCPKVRSSPEL
jgi:glycosyltransferase involved in cell wall biosynthesis